MSERTSILRLRDLGLKGRRVVVVGLGRSGVGAVRLLLKSGASVSVTDSRSASDLAEFQALLPSGVPLEAGGHPDSLLDGADLVVASPGVPLTIPFFKEARRRGVAVIGELELGTRAVDVPVAAITGTNGKSTVTTLLGEMIRAARIPVFVGGNIGNSLCDGVVEMMEGELQPPSWIVAEVSSFQLEATEAFRPRLATILNLTPDHMDRYKTIEDYLAAKARIFLKQAEGDELVLNADDPPVAALARSAPGGVAWFSRQREVARGMYVKGQDVCVRLDGMDGLLLPAEEIRIRGVHNLENAMAASVLALLAGVSADTVAAVLRKFPGLEHRLEVVARKEGVTYINDSKGTNVGAVLKSLESFSGSVILIAGGRDKNSDFRVLQPLVEARVKALVLIGESGEKIAKAAGEGKPQLYARSMEEAVLFARDAAVPGDTVLLSPACASFDMFRNFEHRGQVFKEAVRHLDE